MKPFKDYIDDDHGLFFAWDTPYSKLLLSYSLKNGVCISYKSYYGKSCMTSVEILDTFSKLGGMKISDYQIGNSHNDCWIWKDALVKVVFEGVASDGVTNKNVVSIEISSCNSDLTQELVKIGKTFKQMGSNGSVYVLVPSPHGLVSKNLGISAMQIQKENYTKEVIKGYQAVSNDLKSGNPLGRLSILDGCPGTGKTYLIKALLHDFPNIKFLILPSNMIANLSGPEILSALIDNSDSNNKPSEGIGADKDNCKTPLVLIIEDADTCLTTRGSDNISAISTILNLSDGIIGNLLDLRIVCTTNVDSKDIDEALLRNGRLSARVEVGLLDKEQAYKIYLREGGNPEVVFDKKFYSLADCYALARGKEIATTSKHIKVTGFTNG